MVAAAALLVMVVVVATADDQDVSNHSLEVECMTGSTEGISLFVFPSLDPLWYTTSELGYIAVYPRDQDGKAFGGGVDANTHPCQPEEWGKITLSTTDAYTKQVVFHLCGGGTETRSLEKPVGLGVWSEHLVQWSNCEPPGVAESVPRVSAAVGGWVTAVVLVAAVVALTFFCRRIRRRRRGGGCGCPCRQDVPRRQKDPEDLQDAPSVVLSPPLCLL